MTQVLQPVEPTAAADVEEEVHAPLRIPFGPDGRTRFTREDYLKLVEVGLLEEDSKVELLEGEVVPMSPISNDHSRILWRLSVFFATKLVGRAICFGGGSIAVETDSMPEPDFLIAPFREDLYADGLATAADMLALIEVSVTSLKQNLGRKAKLYARGGAKEYWVAEPEKQTLHVHRKPDAESARWDEIVRLKPGEKVAPLAFPDAELDLAWLFG